MTLIILIIFVMHRLFQRVPRRKFERLDLSNILMMLSLKTDFVSPRKKCGAMSLLLPLRDDHNVGQKKSYQKRYN